MENIAISFTVTNKSQCSDLALECWLDNDMFYDSVVQPGSIDIKYNFIEDEQQHTLKFVLKNKTAEHTKIDESGNILSDVVLELHDMNFDQISLDKILTEHAVYQHDFNGTKEQTQSKFYGTMGCNGAVTFEFASPFYMWLLENM